MSNNQIGALLMMASMFSFTINDTFIKLTQAEIPLAQLLAIRGGMASLLILALALALGRLRLGIAPRAWGLIGLRCLAEIAAAYFFLTALFNMPLANVTAILQALPLTITVGAFLVFREPVGWRRATAIAVGFAGMLLIVRPGAEGFSIWSLYALIAVLCVTARDLVTRRLPPETPSLTATLATSLAVTLWFAVASLADPWVPVSATNWQLLAGSALFVFGGYYFSIETMRIGDVSYVAPFRYTSLIAALALGWLVFGDWPTLYTLIGAGLVVGAGLFTLWREREIRRQSA
ncbi:DMT family transporter [Aliishimia ponticola]|uniref:DMT family transporter n=1 Tax=Aliishimia ponticola TaxID=2499833 RepID=A0A4S4N891_9RHOB|nr:DMT family transporter [Aliishimia ponticola]THH34248.1 DMT family transporter [Aliishimia ponticola]